MFSFFRRQKPDSNLSSLTLKITGMHCSSCSLNIDGELEDLEGVISADTSYAKSLTKVTFDPSKVTPDKIKQVIEALDYTIVKG